MTPEFLQGLTSDIFLHVVKTLENVKI